MTKLKGVWKKFKKYRFQLLKFFLYHMFIPTSSSAWKLKFFRGHCFELCTCVRFFETVFGGLGLGLGIEGAGLGLALVLRLQVLVSVLVLELWSWLQDCY